MTETITITTERPRHIYRVVTDVMSMILTAMTGNPRIGKTVIEPTLDVLSIRRPTIAEYDTTQRTVDLFVDENTFSLLSSEARTCDVRVSDPSITKGAVLKYIERK